MKKIVKFSLAFMAGIVATMIGGAVVTVVAVATADCPPTAAQVAPIAIGAILASPFVGALLACESVEE